MSSLRGGSPSGNGAMSKRDRTPSLTGTAFGMNALAESGSTAPGHDNKSGAWPPSNIASGQHPTHNHEQTGSTLEYNPRAEPLWPKGHKFAPTPSPVSPLPHGEYAELDSPPIQQHGYAQGPRPGPLPVVPAMSQSQSQSSIRSAAFDGRIHPQTLTPGHLGTQMSIQSRGDNTNMSDASTSVSNNRDHEKQDHHSQIQEQTENQGQDQRQSQAREEGGDDKGKDGSDVAPLRATLNATDHERQNNLYSNSWAHI
ncbi:hypothetical protein F5Y17DRAFT_411257 [Xylariaceae sp. FL0594]|nr:hypothetical protein F5Y17DRAFT_411257 [Xylariaceae sp. FL0594]